MEFHILGPLQVVDGGHAVKLGGSKQRSLLAFLLLHPNQVVSRDRLIDELWGDQPPDTAATAIQVHVSQLRKVLGRDVIATQSPGYLIRVRDGELDLERFERSVSGAGSAPPAEASDLLREALALWRGPPLAELDAPFARAAGLRLEEQRLAALEQRIDADLALGRHAQLVPELEGLVREHPLREHLRGQLMVALYRSGRQAQALEVYRTGRRLLDDELGLEPGEELRRLERAILEQDQSLSLPAAAQPAVPGAVPTGTVTFLFTDIEGSTRLVQQLGDEYGALLAHHHALVRDALQEQGGQEIDKQGDALFFAFRRARDAVRASVRAQLAFAAASWPRGVEVRIRIGIHTGEPPGLVEGGYHGLDVVRAARISGAAHGGQVLVSSATRDLVGDALPEISFRNLGEQRLKDIEQTQRIFQAVAAGLRDDFPPLRTEDVARVMTIGGREEELAAAAEAALETEERRVRLFRRSWLVAAAGALLLVAAAAGVVVALTNGSGASVTVLPDSVAVLDTHAAASWPTSRSADARWGWRWETVPCGSRTPMTAPSRESIRPATRSSRPSASVETSTESPTGSDPSGLRVATRDPFPHRPPPERDRADADLRQNRPTSTDPSSSSRRGARRSGSRMRTISFGSTRGRTWSRRRVPLTGATSRSTSGPEEATSGCPSTTSASFGSTKARRRSRRSRLSPPSGFPRSLRRARYG